MDDTLKLVIFDVDGTLIDSQATIVWSMRQAFKQAGRSTPSRSEILGIVGLSLPQAMAVLVPDADDAEHDRMATYYKQSFFARRQAGYAEAEQSLYPGTRDAVNRLEAAGFLISAATGKARRGLDHFLDAQDFRRQFIATQSADDAPSKPNPGMVLNCLAATGVLPRNAVMVGDTEFDMQMGALAGVRCIGVSWGYHPEERVRRGGAEAIARDFAHLTELIEELWP